ncbi:uncharacterized protein TNCV_696732 [Trichonephila clavipes]|nr:uncharacterized protein TNCV_696732 [Trichonephila clavipes]
MAYNVKLWLFNHVPKPIPKAIPVPRPKHNTAFVRFTRVNNQEERVAFLGFWTVRTVLNPISGQVFDEGHGESGVLHSARWHDGDWMVDGIREAWFRCFVWMGFVNGILETGGVMDKCVQMWTRNYGALGQIARVCFGVLCANRKKEEVKRDFGDEKTRKERSRKSSEKTRADRLRKRRGESQSFLLGDADQESETRMSKNALRTGRRQAVDKVKAICNGPRNFEPRSSDMDDIQVSILFSKLSHQGSMKTVGLQWL